MSRDGTTIVPSAVAALALGCTASANSGDQAETLSSSDEHVAGPCLSDGHAGSECVLWLGTSLSAGANDPRGGGLAGRVARRLERACPRISVLVGARRGATIATLRRVAERHAHRRIDLLILEVGANEALVHEEEQAVVAAASELLDTVFELWPAAAALVVDVLPSERLYPYAGAVRRGLRRAVAGIHRHDARVLRVSSDDVWRTLEDGPGAQKHPTPNGYDTLAERTYRHLMETTHTLRCAGTRPD